MSLKEYKKKRDFSKTSEPKGEKSVLGEQLSFVVQRHAARSLHYDFRLEVDGVLKSWAVPKGPSLNPTDKRLAIMVEDHPLDYRTFEGTIPKGNYGAGEVEIWDEGFYEPLHRTKGKTDNATLLEEIKKGSVKIVMHGKKLKGEFALVRMNSDKDENNWLLIKHNDDHAAKEEYNAENETSPSSKVSKKVEKKQTAKKQVIEKQTDKKQKMNSFSKPMVASSASEPFDGDEWIFEIKWDGYRAIAEVGEQLRFYSRNGLSFKGKYPLIESALNKQKHNMILDGEIVAYNNKGMPDFQLLQHFEDNPDVTLIYHVFDLLFLNGHSTKELELMQRKELLKEALTETPNLKFNYHVENEGKAFYKSIEKSDLEGMMAKKKKSTYQEGVRSQAWLKVKNHKTDDAVIVGYTKPQGSRKKFGSLILGQYRDGKLHFAGHVGTGFSDKSLKEIYKLLQPLVTKQVPFDETPPVNAPPTWLKPNLVAVIKYSQMTKENVFRHPVFVGIREDVSAKDLYNDTISGSKKSVSADKKSSGSKESTSSSKESSDSKEPISNDKDSSSESKKSVSNSKNSSSTEDSSSDNKLKLTNLDKLYWKKEKITKGDLIDYYLSVSDYILPHLKDRAQSLHRFPDGIESPGFYHKDAGKGAPSWVKTVHIFSESNNKEIEYIVCNDKDTLGYLINLGCIELNPWNNRIKFPDKPDFMIMDLDPSEKNSFEQVVETAKATKEVLDMAGLTSYCKTSGSTGLHIYVPMGAKYDYDQVRDFGHLVAQLVQSRLPKITTLERSLSKRGPKIYLDYLQNRTGQTVASVYSVRPKPGASVSMPVEWDEVTKDLSIQDFTIRNALDRIDKKGDIFSPVLGKGVDLIKALDSINRSKLS